MDDVGSITCLVLFSATWARIACVNVFFDFNIQSSRRAIKYNLVPGPSVHRIGDK